MIGDLDKERFLANETSFGSLVCAVVDLRGIPVSEQDLPTTNPYLFFLNFDCYVAYRPSLRKKNIGKPFIIVIEKTPCACPRFGSVEELKEIAKNNLYVSFLLKWGEPITDEVLQFLSKQGAIKLYLFPYPRLKAYDKHLREVYKQENGEYPPSEKNMLGYEFTNKAHENMCLLKSGAVLDREKTRDANKGKKK